MTELAVITPTYRVDAEIFADLHRSVLEFTPDSTVHHVFVPKQDRHLFIRYEGARCRIWTSSELLPPRYCAVPGANMHVNVRQPWPLVRGWVMQQAIKIAAAAQLDAKVVLMADSDVVLVRPVRTERFLRPEGITLFRAENAVTPDMRRHVHWHQVARDLLGLPPPPQPPLPDYISPLNFWQPATVREMQVRIADVKGRAWLDAFTSRLHVSEYIVYGVFVDEAMDAGAARPPADTTVCHNEWQRTPLDHDAAEAFANRLGPDAVAVMISAKSRTPKEVRQAAIRRCTEIVRSG